MRRYEGRARRWWRRPAAPWGAGAAAGVAMVTGYFTLPIDQLGPDQPGLSWGVLGCCLGLTAALLARQVRLTFEVELRRHLGLSICVLMCLSVLVFATAYYVLAHHPHQFRGLRTRLDALYFTIATLATIGYGDIVPVGQTSKLLTVVQVLYTFLFLTSAAAALSRWTRARVSRGLGRSAVRGSPEE